MLNYSTSPDDKLLRPNTVAKILDISRMTVYRLVKYGELEGFRTSPRNLRIRQSSITEYLTRLNEGGSYV